MQSHRFFVILISIFFSYSSWAYEAGKTYKVTVLHTNDNHGAFWKNAAGEYGMAARSTLIERIREDVKQQGGYVLLLDGGDVNTGTPESELADAEPDFRGMSMMKYDAMAVGNHEFDKPFDILLKQQKEWANFPFLSANIYLKNSQNRMFAPTKIILLDDLKVSILGLTTEQTPQQSIRFPHDKLEIRSPIEEAVKLVPTLRSSSDIVIAVTHMGHYPNEEHGSRAPGDVTLARNVNGLDLIVGGHTQLPLFKTDYQNGTHIVQAGEWGKHLGRVDLEFKDGKTKLVNYVLIPVNLKKDPGGQPTPLIEEDPTFVNVLSPFKVQTEKLASTKVGVLEGRFEGHRSVIRKQETNLGNFVTHLMAKTTSADVAITDSGVIRNSLEEGPVTFGQILSIHPPAFGLKFVTVDFSGQELWDYLAKVAALTDGAYPQLFGLKVVLKDGQLNKVETLNKVTAEFEALNKLATYKVALTDFIASGGDGYPVVNKHHSYMATDIVDANAMREHFETHRPVRSEDFAPIGNLIKN